MSPRNAVLAAAALAGVGCHSVTRTDTTQVVGRRASIRTDQARALPLTLAVTGDGRWRFVEPLRCPRQEISEVQASQQVRVAANLATFATGVVAMAIGGITGAIGLVSDEPAESPLTWSGAAAVAVGVPLVIGPWLGTRVEHVDRGDRTVVRSLGDAPCGERGVAGRSAVLTFRGLRVVGSVDGDGYFSVSPFALVDAFDVGGFRGLALAAEVATAKGNQRLQAVIDATALASARDGFFAATGIDGSRGAMRKVPDYQPGPVRATRSWVAGQPMLRLALVVANRGLGPGYQVRGLVHSELDELDGRFLYFGQIAAGGEVAAELMVPISPAVEQQLGADTLDLSVTLRDGHDTAPATPVRFRGAVLQEPPR